MAAITAAQLQGANTGRFLQGGSGIRLQSGATPQNTLSIGSLQPTSLSTINQEPVSSGGGGVAAPSAPVDPYAGTVWGSTAAYNKARSDYDTARANTYGSIGDAQSTAANQYKSSILDFVDTLKSGRQALDRQGVQAEMARAQGRLGILDMIGNGIRSQGVALNNANATNSSAADAIARAYGTLGQREMSKVGNQYAVAQENIKTGVQDLDNKIAQFRRHADESKIGTVNSIVQTAADALQRLDAAAASASLPDRVAIEQEKARIRNETLAQLQGVDSILNENVAGNPLRTAEGNRQEAQRLMQAGTAPDTSFDFTSSIPVSLLNSGPFATNLPIFVGRRPDDRDLVGA